MKLIICLATVTLGIGIAQPIRAATTREVYNIAKSVMARIDVSQDGQLLGRGSGFLLKKRGNVYSLVISKNVTKCPEHSCTYPITTAFIPLYVSRWRIRNSAVAGQSSYHLADFSRFKTDSRNKY